MPQSKGTDSEPFHCLSGGAGCGAAWIIKYIMSSSEQWGNSIFIGTNKEGEVKEKIPRLFSESPLLGFFFPPFTVHWLLLHCCLFAFSFYYCTLIF